MLAAALVLSVPGLAACGGQGTEAIYNPTEGVNNRDGQVDVLHALVVSDGKDGGRLIAGLVNNDQTTADELVDVTPAAGSSAQVEVGEGDKEIPSGGLLQLADDDAAQVLVQGVESGGYVRVTFSFQNAEDVTLNVPVVQGTDDFADVEVPGQVTPSVTMAQEPTPAESSSGE